MKAIKQLEQTQSKGLSGCWKSNEPDLIIMLELNSFYKSHGKGPIPNDLYLLMKFYFDNQNTHGSIERLQNYNAVGKFRGFLSLQVSADFKGKNNFIFCCI